MSDLKTDPGPSNESGSIESADKSAFVAVAPLYDLLMHDVPYDDWVGYLYKLLDARNAKPRHILDLACGTGNVTERLAKAGYDITGVDISPEMIAEAKCKASAHEQSIDYFVQDAAELDLPGRRFDLCISLFDSLNYVTDPNRLALAIERVGLHLSRNGLFIFDLNTEFALKNNFFDQTNRLSNAPLRYDWESEYYPTTRRCRVRMRFWYREGDGEDRCFEEEHWQFAYSSDEIKTMLQNAGFDDIATYQAYSLRAPGRTADRIFYVARKA